MICKYTNARYVGVHAFPFISIDDIAKMMSNVCRNGLVHSVSSCRGSSSPLHGLNDEVAHAYEGNSGFPRKTEGIFSALFCLKYFLQ